MSPDVYKGTLAEMSAARKRHARARLIREHCDTVLAGLASYGTRRRRRPGNRASLLDTVMLRR